MSFTTTSTIKANTSKPKTISLSSIPPIKAQNPQLILTHDIVRNTKTLHYTINTAQPPSPDREYSITMRGYSGIMSSSSSSECDIQCNGEKVDIKKQAHLWQPKETQAKEEPLWHLRISVLKDQEGRGDAPSRRFAFKSMHHLTHAANQLESAFATSFDMRKCGCEAPDAMGGRVNDGRCENITIEYDSETAKEGWTEFLGRLKTLEDEWEHEGMSHL